MSTQKIITDRSIPKYQFYASTTTNKEALEHVKKNLPGVELDVKKLHNLVKKYHLQCIETCINNKEGVELPQGMGIIAIGAIPVSIPNIDKMKQNVTKAEAQQKFLKNLVVKSEQHLAKIFYTNFNVRQEFNNRNIVTGKQIGRAHV